VFTLVATLFSLTAQAEPIPRDRPWTPSAGVAAEPGPSSGWVNPALSGFDPDPRLAAALAASRDGGRSAALSGGVGGLLVGVGMIRDADGTERGFARYGSGAELPGRVSLGTAVTWHLVGGSGNHLAFDLGAAWRPTPTLGVAGAVHNVGAPDPRGELPTRAIAGVAWRPSGRSALFGLDVERTGGDDGRTRAVAAMRLRPVDGIFLRATADTDRSVFFAVEAYLGGVGGLAGAAVGRSHGPVGTVVVGTDEPDESLLGPPRPTWVVDLRTDLPTTARAPLLGPARPGHLDTLARLRALRQGPPPRAILVKLGGARPSWALRHEIRDELAALRARGIPVVAWLDGAPGPGDVWLASVAEVVLAHPAADIGLVGPRRRLTYFAGLFDRLGVRFEVIRRGDYKSAVEPQTRESPSPETLEQELALLDGLHDRLVADLAADRRVDAARAAAWLDGPWTAAEAAALGIVDDLVWPDALPSWIEAKVLGGRPLRARPLESVPRGDDGWAAPGRVAIIPIEGVILPGDSSPGLLGPRAAGSRTIVGLLQRAIDDPTIRAVVLRVDSPGGSLYASEEIARAADAVREAGKPVVASFGGVAASGGYFVATGADAIWAEPTTITGSIGIFLQKPDFSPVLGELGIRFTTLARGGGAVLDTTRPLSEAERARFDAIVGAGYDRFKLRVGDARGLTPEAVEQVARGRVWSGEDAARRGLVDGQGSFLDAADDARRRAGLPPDAPVVVLSPGASSTLARLVPLLSSVRLTRGARRSRDPLAPLLDEIALQTALAREGLWLLAPFDPETR
jgi:protease-4